MLKRQRPVSPSPISPDYPMDLDSSLLTCHKRRKTLSPSQPSDPQFKPIHTHSQSEDESDLDDPLFNDSHHVTRRRDVQDVPSSSEYKAVNSLLRDLHALHQHRLIFSQPSLRPVLSSPHHNRPAAILSTPRSRSALGLELSSPSELFRQDMADATQKSLGSHEDYGENIGGRYEGVNRVLGSLFLTRRRQLGDPESGRS